MAAKCEPRALQYCSYVSGMFGSRCPPPRGAVAAKHRDAGPPQSNSDPFGRKGTLLWVYHGADYELARDNGEAPCSLGWTSQVRMGVLWSTPRQSGTQSLQLNREADREHGTKSPFPPSATIAGEESG